MNSQLLAKVIEVIDKTSEGYSTYMNTHFNHPLSPPLYDEVEMGVFHYANKLCRFFKYLVDKIFYEPTKTCVINYGAVQNHDDHCEILILVKCSINGKQIPMDGFEMLFSHECQYGMTLMFPPKSRYKELLGIFAKSIPNDCNKFTPTFTIINDAIWNPANEETKISQSKFLIAIAKCAFMYGCTFCK